MKITAESKRKFLTVYVPDTRGVIVSRYGRANLKIGMGDHIYTYSRLPGEPDAPALGGMSTGGNGFGTCPGATLECQNICYAARVVAERGPAADMWKRNSETADVPPIPDDCRLLRIHVSGDFDSVLYIENWIKRLRERMDVQAWAYTRSWRVPELLAALERLRARPNIQLFASMDKSTVEEPPTDWRRAWIADDGRLATRLYDHDIDFGNADRNHVAIAGVDGGEYVRYSFTCPEETGHKANCEECRYCIDGQRHDVTFLKH